MKVQIEKINKKESFKPFNCILNFQNENEVREYLKALIKRSEDVLDLPDPLFLTYDALRTELQNQGCIEPEIYED